RQADGAKRLVRLVPRRARARHPRCRRGLHDRSRPARGRHHRAVPGAHEQGRLMLAYRHAFHAGNHADVLKHLVLMLVLGHMNAKDKPYRLDDTHAVAGGYSLLGRYAQKKGEYERGVGVLWTRDDL